MIKVAVVGHKQVGKTSLIRRYVHDDFSQHYFYTHGGDIEIKDIVVNSNAFRVHFLDAAGHQFQRKLIQPIYRDVHGILVVYDVTRNDTFSDISEWLKNINEENQNNPVVYMIGNKQDLDSHRKVKVEDAVKQSHHLDLPFYETSAKTGYNVNNMVLALLTDVIQTKGLVSGTKELKISIQPLEAHDLCCSIV